MPAPAKKVTNPRNLMNGKYTTAAEYAMPKTIPSGTNTIAASVRLAGDTLPVRRYSVGPPTRFTAAESEEVSCITVPVDSIVRVESGQACGFRRVPTPTRFLLAYAVSCVHTATAGIVSTCFL